MRRHNMESRIRNTERRFKQTGDVHDRARMLAVRARAEPKFAIVVKLASTLGLKAAMIAFPEPYRIPLRAPIDQVDRNHYGLEILRLDEGLEQIAPGHARWILSRLAIRVVDRSLEEALAVDIVPAPPHGTRGLLGVLNVPGQKVGVVLQHLYSRVQAHLVTYARQELAEELIDWGQLPLLKGKRAGG